MSILRGILVSWTNSIGIKVALIELPQSFYSYSDAVNGRYLQKSINAVTNLIGGSCVSHQDDEI